MERIPIGNACAVHVNDLAHELMLSPKHDTCNKSTQVGGVRPLPAFPSLLTLPEMADAPTPPNELSATGCLLGFGIGVLTITLFYGALSIVTGRPMRMSEEWGFTLLHMLIVAAPFVLLALAGVTAKVPWLVGFGLTAIFWGFLFLDVVLIHRGEGASIGLGWLMLLSPFVIAGSSLAAAKLTGTLPDP